MNVDVCINFGTYLRIPILILHIDANTFNIFFEIYPSMLRFEENMEKLIHEKENLSAEGYYIHIRLIRRRQMGD